MVVYYFKQESPTKEYPTHFQEGFQQEHHVLVVALAINGALIPY